MTVIQDIHLGIFVIIPANLIGIASLLCLYGTIPIAASFSQKGMCDDYLAAFMMSSATLGNLRCTSDLYHVSLAESGRICGKYYCNISTPFIT